ncbi:MAG: HAMP domain-containing protein [Chloroflexi bacterium]|nr:HAMP domain-containing protein [Chloroflexota bacterium]
MLLRQSLRAGLVTGLLMAFLMLLIFWTELRVVWPMAFVPLFATGVYAVHRAGRSVAGTGAAALAGALGGLAAAVVSLVAVVVVSILAEPPRPYPLWNLAPVLLDSPFFIPPGVLFYNVPALPFHWPVSGVTPEGMRVSRIPWSLPLFLPVGTLLSALQAWLYYALLRRANVDAHAVGRIAKMRASFQNKLLMGFVILSAMVFAAGWLGWAQTEEMHLRTHQGRVTQHWLDHALRVQANLRALVEALARLGSARDEAVLQDISTLRQRIIAELTHLKTVPPPAHPAALTGATRSTQVAEAEKRLPSVREVDSRFSDYGRVVARADELYRAGNAAEAQAVLLSLGPLQRMAEASLGQLVEQLNADLRTWVAETDQNSHGQQFATMLLALLATGLAFPLGYVFAQVVIRPVNEVGKGLERIGSGEFSTHVHVENQDELGVLAQRVNQMTAELDGLYRQLRDLNENLQQKVAEQLREIEHARVLKRYLSPQVADAILAGQSDVKLSTTRKNLTVCFSDIRGFTALSERMEPEELIDLINGYFTAMTDIVFEHGGTLDKYLGDGLLVFFGDPVPYDDHAERAIRMALDMRARLAELQKGWFLDRQDTLHIGVGISTGYVTVGNIGSPARLEYTVIGNNVNLAPRLGDTASPGQILITERTLLAARGHVQAREVGEMTVEGSARPVRVYEVVDQVAPAA